MSDTFDRVATIYSQGRIGYPPDLYQRIDDFKSFTEDSRLLEIGAGNGLATEEVSDHWHPQITAIDPGRNLIRIAQQRLHHLSNIQFIHNSFKRFTSQHQFDGIYSATAFHWIDPAIRYRKSYELLKDDGLLFLFWNREMKYPSK